MKSLLTLLFCAAMFAQSEKPKDPPIQYYRLDFTVKELEEAKVISSRNYSMSLSTDKTAHPSSIRTGTRVPYQTSSNQYQFADVGVNIDCRTSMLFDSLSSDGMISLSVSAEISSLATEGDIKTVVMPVIRQNKWSAMVLVPLRKPTTIFSSDDVASRRKMQLELTVTPLR